MAAGGKSQECCHSLAWHLLVCRPPFFAEGGEKVNNAEGCGKWMALRVVFLECGRPRETDIS